MEGMVRWGAGLCVLLALAGCEKAPERASSAATTTARSTAAHTAPAQAAQPAAGAVEAPGELGPGSPLQQDGMVKAKILYLNNKLEEAEPLFKALAESEPVSSPQVSAAIALGDIYTSTGRPEQALALYDELLERVGELAEVHLVVGRAYVELEQDEKALKAYREVLKLQPSYVFLWVEMGQLLAKQGKAQESTQALLTYEKRIYAMSSQLTHPGEVGLEERLHLIDMFSFVQDDKVTQTLLTVASSDPDFEARAAASRALGSVMAVSARPVLEEIARGDGSGEVREAAREALEVMKGVESPGEGDVAAPTFVDDPEELGK